MSPSKILVREDEKHRILPPAPTVGWGILGAIGLGFAVLAAMDLALTWYPFRFGDAEWEFGTVSAMLDGMPLLAMGLGLILGARAAVGSKLGVSLMGVLFLVLAVGLGFSAVLYIGNIDVARAAVTDPTLRMGLNRGISKAMVQAVVYPVAFFWLGLVALRHARN